MSHSKSAAATKRIVGDTRINEDASEGHGAKYKVGKAVWAIDVGDVVYTCTVVHFTVAWWHMPTNMIHPTEIISMRSKHFIMSAFSLATFSTIVRLFKG